MFGEQAVTNYIHFWSSGHFRYFLKRYGNLYRFSGVGGEANMGTLRGYFFKRTQRGGHAGKDGEQASLLAMRSYMLRSTLWCLGDISLDPSYVENIYKREKALRISGLKEQRKLDNKERKMQVTPEAIVINSGSHDEQMNE